MLTFGGEKLLSRDFNALAKMIPGSETHMETAQDLGSRHRTDWRYRRITGRPFPIRYGVRNGREVFRRAPGLCREDRWGASQAIVSRGIEGIKAIPERIFS